MKKKQLRIITEESILFLSIFKWVFLATVIGIIVGGTTSAFIKVLNICITSVGTQPYYFLCIPIALYLSALLSKTFSPESEGHGTEKVIEAIHKNSGKIKASVVPIKICTTILTIAAGGSAGKEGPSAQIGAALSALFASFMKFSDYDRRKLVICGISAGFASVFGTPIAGAIFGVEVLFVGSMLYEVLLPSFVAGIVGYQISSLLGTHYHYHIIELIPAFNLVFFLKVVFAGIIFGLLSIFFIESMKKTKDYINKVTRSIFYKALIGGIVLITITIVFTETYLGLGLQTVQDIFNGETLPWYAFILKTISTHITLSCGGSGGILTPIFFVGATAGTVYASLLGLNTIYFGAIGLVSLLAGTCNTPIAATILAVELFGSNIATYATIACVISFLMSGCRSVYPSQMISGMKAHPFTFKTGDDIEHTDIHLDYASRKRVARSKHFARKITNFKTLKKNLHNIFF